MADIPSDVPEWASNPPANTITTPTSTQRQNGWQPGRVRRQFSNWLADLTHRWILWFRQAVFRSSDLAPDQAFGGAAPVTGAGLTVAAASFSTAGYVDGYRVATTSAQGYTYGANSDTYWDLGRDAVWRPVVVASGDPEPAVTSSPPSVRVYHVRTNGTDRTLVVDRRRTRVALSGGLDVLAGLRLGVERDELTAATLTTIPADGVGATYSLIDQWTADLGGPNEHSVRVYVTGTVADRRVFLVHGAEWQGGAGNPSLAEIDEPRRTDLMPTLRTSRMLSVVAGDTFLDSTWWSAGDVTLSIGSPTNIAGALATTGAVAVGTALSVAGTTTLTGAATAEDDLDVDGTLTVAGGLGVTGTSFLGAVSATSAAVVGAATAGSLDVSGAAEVGSLVVDAAATVTTDLLVGGRGTLDTVALGSLGAAAPPANVFDAANLPKAWVLFTIDPSGAITVAHSKNVASVALVGSTGILVTFQRAFALGTVPVMTSQVARTDVPYAMGAVWTARSTTTMEFQIYAANTLQTLNGGAGVTFSVDAVFHGRQ